MVELRHLRSLAAIADSRRLADAAGRVHLTQSALSHQVRALEVHYGGIRAVKGIDLRVEPGELVCLIGAHGAGKSSTPRAICGPVPGGSGRAR